MREKNMPWWPRAARMAAAAVVVLVTATSCPMPFITSVRERIDKLVASEAEISVLVNGVEIADGGMTDAFSPAVQGQPTDVVFTVCNTGIGSLVFREESPVELSGADVALFSVLTQPSTASVATDGSAEFTIRLVLDSPGTKVAKINLYSNDADKSPYEITVSNTALPEIQVLRGETEIPSGTGTLDLGTTTYGVYGDVTLTIKNMGKANLDLTGASPVTVTGTAFSVLTQPASPLAPGASTTFTVRNLAGWLSTVAETLSIAGSDADENPYTVAVSATTLLETRATRVDGGGGSTVALKDDGAVWMWGRNDSGNLGDGTTTSRHVPVRVSGLTGVASVAADLYFSMALKDDGTVWTWGDNEYGQLGNGAMPTDSLVPVRVTGLTGVVAVTSGGESAMALKSDGTVWAWGYNGSGKLGDGTATNRGAPVRVSGLSSVIAIVTGSSHTVALRSDGRVFAWGENDHGQLGNGAMGTDSLTPVEVSGLEGVAEISVIANTTLARTTAGAVKAWGYNVAGQLGDNSTTDRDTPVQVSGLTAGVAAIAAGGLHSVALKSDGTVWTWGDNASGQLGNGAMPTDSLVPVQASGLSGITLISAGGSHAMAVDGAGVLWTWGNNAYGQLGDDSTTNKGAPGKVIGMADVICVAAGGWGYTGALMSDGTLWRWGGNVSTPARIAVATGFTAITQHSYNALALKADGTVWRWSVQPAVRVTDITGVQALAPGASHTAALKTDGSVWTWGDNAYGQLGNGDMPNDSDVPVRVSTWTDVTAIASGDHHTLVLRSDGTVWAWGRNNYGQLGNGTTGTDMGAPIQVPTLTDVTSIGAGVYYSLAHRFDGSTHSSWAWGFNGFGQLGIDSTGGSVSTPTQVNGLAVNVTMVGGQQHSVALRYDGGAVWAWGDNQYGQLGDGTTTNDDSPVGISGLVAVTSVVAGALHSAALKFDGTVWAWGNNMYGQLGDGTTTNRNVPVRVALDFSLQ